MNVKKIIDIHLYYGSVNNYLEAQKNSLKYPQNTYVDEVLPKVYNKGNVKIIELIKESYERSIKIDATIECVNQGLISGTEEMKKHFKEQGISTSSKFKIR